MSSVNAESVNTRPPGPETTLRMRYRYYTADVFTDRIFGGNPLAVFPNAEGLSQEQMQRVARELNLSETVFVRPPKDLASCRQLRIFTPAMELPFAGHPTLGSAHVLALLGEIEARTGETEVLFEEGIGPITVRIQSDGKTPSFTQLDVAKMPEFAMEIPSLRSIASALSLDISDLLLGDDRPMAVSCGVPFLVVPLRSLDSLARARLDRETWESSLQDTWAPNLYAFVYDAETEGADLRARVFAPALGVEEDPATGAGAASLAGYLCSLDAQGQGSRFWTVEQGFEMGRPSLIKLEADMEQSKVIAIRIGGASVLVGEAWIEVPGPGEHGGLTLETTAQAQTQAQTQAPVQTEAAPKAGATAEPEPKAEPQSKAEPEPKVVPAAKDAEKPKAADSDEAAAKTKPEADEAAEAAAAKATASAPAAQAKPELKPTPKAKAEPPAKPEPEAKPEPDAKAKPDAKAEPEATPEPQAEAETKPGPGARPEPAKKAEAKPEPKKTPAGGDAPAKASDKVVPLRAVLEALTAKQAETAAPAATEPAPLEGKAAKAGDGPKEPSKAPSKDDPERRMGFVVDLPGAGEAKAQDSAGKTPEPEAAGRAGKDGAEDDKAAVGKDANGKDHAPDATTAALAGAIRKLAAGREDTVKGAVKDFGEDEESRRPDAGQEDADREDGAEDDDLDDLDEDNEAWDDDERLGDDLDEDLKRFRRQEHYKLLWSATLRHGDQIYACVIIDLSPKAALLQIEEELAYDLTLKFDSPVTLKNDKIGRLKGEVAWRDKNRLGVELLEDPSEVSKILDAARN